MLLSNASVNDWEEKCQNHPLLFNHLNIIPHFIFITEKIKTRMYPNLLLHLNKIWQRPSSLCTHSLLPITRISIHMLMKTYTCVCVLLVSIHSFPTSWFLPREEGEVLKSYRKKKKVVTFNLPRIKKCPKSQEGNCPAEIRALLL